MNRRSFIQKISLIGGALVFSMPGQSFSFFSAAKKVKGRITDGSNGIAGVVVSDGYSVVTTNSRGYYSIKPHANASSVWVSTPAGYAFLHEQGVSRHYHQLGSGKSYDFELKRLSQSDQQHKFIVWADPQVKTRNDVKQMMETSVPDVQQLLKTMGSAALVHGICVGDIVWDKQELFQDYNTAVAKMGIPFFQALGNHDMDYRMGGDETSDVTFKKTYGPTYYSFNRGKAHYVVLENVRYLGTDRDYDGYLVEEQLSWLEKDLEHVAKDQLLIINLHIPVHSGVKNKEALYKVLEGYTNVHIMSGHTHYNKNVISNGIYEHNHGTVCGAWWTGPVCEDGTPRGYGVYDVDGTNLKWYYKSTGEDRTNQLSAFIETLDGQKTLTCNVYNWDPEWKVEYFLDGRQMGVMENQVGFDPLATKLYKGPELPAGRHFPEPRKTDHLFVARIDAAVKQIKVVATDRFGEQFSKEIQA